ncbi:ecto-ADP-ribosyltransferase 4-like [Labeo rohita]|uniref:ecto-ADP-ribosyltransferase 4-like n=1 Tax=Labeo rohita TaxID=84645 RepID=UPI0021E260E7|nr:ecto-ADP-ribosyltransferase 4-like [Labeo rohita]XP_050959323.1 ecto-ADP-ribosyltransferase 4-like [Labeo rohita]
MKMLLIIEALLLILAALGQDHRAAVEGKIITLDMAPNSVDDQYDGCREKMAKLVETKYLKKEFKNSKDNFKEAWKDCENKIKKPRDNLNRNHLIAICVYTGNRVYREFNKDVGSDNLKYKDKTFKWYALHFFLTEAIQILKSKQNECQSIYRRTKHEYKVKKGEEFRFGSFASFSLDYSQTIDFGDKSCFEIKKYKGAELTKYSEFPHEQEVLIPPYETFKVTDVKTRTYKNKLWCKTVFVLEITGTRSTLNCALFKPSFKNMIKKLFCGCCGS